MSRLNRTRRNSFGHHRLNLNSIHPLLAYVSKSALKVLSRFQLLLVTLQK